MRKLSYPQRKLQYNKKTVSFTEKSSIRTRESFNTRRKLFYSLIKASKPRRKPDMQPVPHNPPGTVPISCWREGKEQNPENRKDFYKTIFNNSTLQRN